MVSRGAINSAEHSGRQRSTKPVNKASETRTAFFEIARGSALERASTHDVLSACDAIDGEPNRQGTSELKRIVSMLTGLIQRTESVSEGSIEHEYEYE